jgi:hypothetical protein
MELMDKLQQEAYVLDFQILDVETPFLYRSANHIPDDLALAS